MIENFKHNEIRKDSVLNKLPYLSMYVYIKAIDALNRKSKDWVTLENYHLLPLKPAEQTAISHLRRVRGLPPTK